MSKERSACLGDIEPQYAFKMLPRPDSDGEVGPVQLQRLARGYLRERRHMEALVLAKKGAKLFPSFALDFDLLLAEVYVARGDRKQARALLEAVSAKHPHEERVQQALARVSE